MPIYEYSCKECGNRFEELVGVTGENRSVKCDACGSDNVEKLLSSFNGGSTGSGKDSEYPAACPSCSGQNSGGCPI